MRHTKNPQPKHVTPPVPPHRGEVLLVVILAFLAAVAVLYTWLGWQLTQALTKHAPPPSPVSAPFTATASSACGEWAEYDAKQNVIICAPHGKDLGAGVKSNWEVK